jgi:two-component system alkaline phosphatase synthesis response regulator PhoP
MSGECILIVDDEANIVELARLYLQREGFRIESTSDGLLAITEIERLQPALVILDIMLPGIDGLEVCRRLRLDRNLTPILMLTARDEDIDKIIGLELGADDYLTKPFNPRELVARVNAILRRTDHSENLPHAALHLGDLVIDPARREVRVGTTFINLRYQEFNLLLVLVEHKGLVLSREQLLNLAWGFDYYGQTRTVDVHIGSLRKKLQGSSVRIETVTSGGYKLKG